MYKVRPINLEDENEISEVLDMAIEYLEQEPVNLNIPHALKNLDYNMEHSPVLLLLSDEKVVGALNYAFLEDIWSGEKFTYKLNYFVRPEHRGNGKLLIEELEKISKAEGSNELRFTMPFPLKGWFQGHTEYRKKI